VPQFPRFADRPFLQACEGLVLTLPSLCGGESRAFAMDEQRAKVWIAVLADSAQASAIPLEFSFGVIPNQLARWRPLSKSSMLPTEA
jgi:hypothetical protein